MKRAAAASVLVLLAACGGPTGDTHQPDSGPTLPPGGAFRDGLLYAAVKTRLAGADIDSATRISVVVHDGAVTLRGVVADAAAKAGDARMVRAMRGVKSLDDELRVGRTGPSTAQTIGDAALLAAVESALVAQTGVNVTGVHVHANAGTVTLTGHAATPAIKSTMLAAVRKTPGVRNVVDRLAVR